MSDDDWWSDDDDYVYSGGGGHKFSGGGGHKSSGGGGGGGGGVGFGICLLGIGALLGFVLTKLFSGGNRGNRRTPPHGHSNSSNRGGASSSNPGPRAPTQPPSAAQPGPSGTQRPSPFTSATAKRADEEEHVRRRVAGRKQESELNKAPDQVKCIVCFSNEREVVLFPCRHTCICLDCSKRVQKCPYCCKNITDKNVTYLP